MTRSDFHRSTILKGDLFSFQADTGEAWREESLFDQDETELARCKRADVEREPRPIISEREVPGGWSREYLTGPGSR